MAQGRRTGAGVLLPAALGCLLLVVLASVAGPVPLSGDSPLDRILPADGFGEAPAEEEDVAVEAESDEVPTAEPVDGTPVEVVLALAVVVVCGALLARSVLRSRREPEETDDAADDDLLPGDGLDTDVLVDAARQGLLRLHEVPPGARAEAVVACWVELELAGGAAGSGRRAPDTPTDFAERLVATAPGVDRAALDDLRRLYSRVRFAGPASPAARVDDDEVARARAALESVLSALGVARPAARGGDR